MKYRIFCVFLSLFFGVSSAAQAGLIRDAESEHTLRLFADPIFRAAQLDPSRIKLFIIEDDVINAYVAGGENMFLHTGLLLAADQPGMLLGVIAHETGHIAGGHLARGGEQLRKAQLGTILSFVLGAAAGAAGSGQAAAGVIAGGQQATLRTFLAFTRANEQAADQAALKFLDALHISATGMADMFSLLERNERMHGGTPDPYAQTHPLSAERVRVVEHHIETSSIPAGQIPSNLALAHARMLAKLRGFLWTPEQTLAKYPPRDQSLPGMIARAVAYYKMPDIERALGEIDAAIKQYPTDGYLYELRGQILFENRRVEEAMKSYARAVELLPEAGLIHAALGETQLALNLPALLPKAITQLERATQLDDSYSHAWRLLATAYGKAGKLGMSYLALAEEAALADDKKEILRNAKQALAQLPPKSPAAQRAHDLQELAKQIDIDSQ